MTSHYIITHYRRREVRNSIYRYRKIHIDYRSEFSYRFISSISIIYGNTRNFRTSILPFQRCQLGFLPEASPTQISFLLQFANLPQKLHLPETEYIGKNITGYGILLLVYRVYRYTATLISCDSITLLISYVCKCTITWWNLLVCWRGFVCLIYVLPPFHYFPNFSALSKYTLAITFTFIFDRCHRSLAAVAPVKHQCETKNPTGTFARSKILVK